MELYFLSIIHMKTGFLESFSERVLSAMRNHKSESGWIKVVINA